MKKTRLHNLLWAGVAVICFAAVPALAEDAPAPASDITSWAGPYIGLHFGGMYSRLSESGAYGPTGSTSSLLGGAQVGYNWQHEHLVLGLELDASKFNISSESEPLFSYDQDWMITSRARLGYAVGRYLPYITAGLAYTDTHIKIPVVAGQSAIETGASAGAGLDYLVATHWVARVEFLYTDVPRDDSSIGTTPVSARSANNTLRIGVNYKF